MRTPSRALAVSLLALAAAGTLHAQDSSQAPICDPNIDPSCATQPIAPQDQGIVSEGGNAQIQGQPMQDGIEPPFQAPDAGVFLDPMTGLPMPAKDPGNAPRKKPAHKKPTNYGQAQSPESLPLDTLPMDKGLPTTETPDGTLINPGAAEGFEQGIEPDMPSMDPTPTPDQQAPLIEQEDPMPAPVPESFPEPVPTQEPVPEPLPEPVPTQEPVPEPLPEPVPTQEPIPEPLPEPVPMQEPIPESQPHDGGQATNDAWTEPGVAGGVNTPNSEMGNGMAPTDQPSTDGSTPGFNPDTAVEGTEPGPGDIAVENPEGTNGEGPVHTDETQTGETGMADPNAYPPLEPATQDGNVPTNTNGMTSEDTIPQRTPNNQGDFTNPDPQPELTQSDTGEEPSDTMGSVDPQGAPVKEDQPEAIDTTTRAAVEADPIVQESVAVFEKALSGEQAAAFGADPATPAPGANADPNTTPTDEVTTLGAVDDGAVLGVLERNITEARRANEEYRGAVSSNPTFNSAQRELARERERRARLEGVGLGAIAGLVVGAIIADHQEVVAVAPERVIVIDRTTNVYQVWRDDDALLRRPGARETISVLRDGSTRTVLDMPNGDRVETVRDATGRVLFRERLFGTNRNSRVVLVDDVRTIAPIDVRSLPAPAVPRVFIPRTVDPVFGAELVRSSQTRVDRAFSLAQIRNIWEVRRLAPSLATDPVLFETGSAALGAAQAQALSGIAAVMIEMLRANPREMFLVEGHTDAVGSAAFNLALSDRRAETVAQALVDYFGVPPENLVFQGYGEAVLAVPTQVDEPRNRRVDLRRITSLLDPRVR